MDLHNIEIEQSTIGGLITNPQYIPEITAIIKGTDFYGENNKAIFETVIEMHSYALPINEISVKDTLKKKGKLNDIGVNYVTIISNAASGASTTYHAKRIKELSTLREIEEHAIGVLRALENPVETDRFISLIAEKFVDIATVHGGDTARTANLSDAIQEVFMQATGDNPPDSQGIKSGYPTLDRILGGFKSGKLYILAARTSVGKSAMAVNIAVNAAIKNTPVVVFTLEMDINEIATRALSVVTEIDSARIKQGKLDEGDGFNYHQKYEKIKSTYCIIEEASGRTLPEIRSKARQHLSNKEGGLIIVDYLQLVSGTGNSEKRYLEVGDISRGLKRMSQQLKVPVIALSQLSRAIDSRADKTPQLSDLRESGNLEQDADVVMFLHKEEEQAKTIELRIAKHRGGALANFPLNYIPNLTKFTEQSRDYR